MATGERVFIAPSAFFAFIDRAHPKHDQAVAYFRFFSQEKYLLFTDTASINHAYELIYKEISPSLGKDFLRSIFLGNIHVIFPEESDAKAAVKALITFRSPELLYSHALMAVLAYRRSITTICTFEPLQNLFGQTVFYLPM